MSLLSKSDGRSKNAKEYILEGLMIFVAVCLGFFAEQFREEMLDRDDEEEYLISMMEDLETDIGQYPRIIKNYTNRNKVPTDSLPILLKNPKKDQPANDIYFHLRWLIRQSSFRSSINDRTITQMRNAGKYQLIRNQTVSDSIVAYYKAIDVAKGTEDFLFIDKNALRERLANILDGEMYDKVINDKDQIVRSAEPLYLTSTNPKDLSDCVIRISNIRGLNRALIQNFHNLQNQAERLKQLIKREYGL